ncbi:flagellar biosynthetic protein FliO [Azoarcus olearius]|uniref:flagellar biosynthetic protein FliO n=1 Tax=Azoarcus sp. (strain BH72) TaxID=418699 RepID=UPI000A7F4888
MLALYGGAVAAADSAAAAPPELAGSIGQMLGGLAVVIALLFGCLWVLKRLATPRGAAAAVKVLGAAAVGPRERVVLVEVGKDVLVLGVAPGNVRTLHVIPLAELPPPPAQNGPLKGGADFSSWLKQSLERRKDAP